MATFHPVISTMVPGEWRRVVAGTNTKLVDLAPSPLPPGNSAYPGGLFAWSGGAYDSTRNRGYMHGGGHQDYAGNEIYAFDVASETWSRPFGPSPNAAIPQPPPDLVSPPPVFPGETYSDGNPASIHSYGGLAYAANIDRLLRFEGSLWSGGGTASYYMWEWSPSTNTWTILNTSKPSFTDIEAIADWDGVDTLWCSGNGMAFTAFSYTSGTYGATLPAGTFFEAYGRIDHATNQMIAVGLGGYQATNLTTGANVTSSSGPQNVVNALAPGITYDSNVGELVGWAGGSTVYRLNGTTHTWTAVPSSLGTGPAVVTGRTFGRWMYMPDYNAYLLINDGDEPYYYKLTADTPDVTPPDPPSNLRVTGVT